MARSTIHHANTMDLADIANTANPSERLFTNGTDAVRSVSKERGPWNWVLVEPGVGELILAAGGCGSIDEMRSYMLSHTEKTLFGLLRLHVGTGVLKRKHHVMVYVYGRQSMSDKRVSKAGHVGHFRNMGLIGIMEKKFREHAPAIRMSFEIRHPEEDLTVESVLDRLKQMVTVDHSHDDFSIQGFNNNLVEEQHRGNVMQQMLLQKAVQTLRHVSRGHEARDSICSQGSAWSGRDSGPEDEESGHAGVTQELTSGSMSSLHAIELSSRKSALSHADTVSIEEAISYSISDWDGPSPRTLDVQDADQSSILKRHGFGSLMFCGLFIVFCVVMVVYWKFSQNGSPEELGKTIHLKFIVENLSYTKMVSKPRLIDNVKEKVTTAIVGTAPSVSTQDVDVDVSAGSVLVDVRIRTPSEVAAGSVNACIHSNSSYVFSRTLVANLLEIPDIGDFTEGSLRVLDLDPGPMQFDLASRVFLSE